MCLSGGLLGEQSETCACRHDRGDSVRVFARSGEVKTIDLVEYNGNGRIVSNMTVGYCEDGKLGEGSELTLHSADWSV